MIRNRLSVSLIFGAVLAAAPAFAHHSFQGTYDSNQPLTIQGVVVKVELRNPHAHFYVDAKDESGQIVHWNLEAASAFGLAQRGVNRDSIKEGDQVTVSAYRSKKELFNASVGRFVMADGREFVVADTFGAALGAGYPGIVEPPAQIIR